MSNTAHPARDGHERRERMKLTMSRQCKYSGQKTGGARCKRAAMYRHQMCPAHGSAGRLLRAGERTVNDKGWAPSTAGTGERA